jgi:hypothetical protein
MSRSLRVTIVGFSLSYNAAECYRDRDTNDPSDMRICGGNMSYMSPRSHRYGFQVALLSWLFSQT